MKTTEDLKTLSKAALKSAQLFLKDKNISCEIDSYVDLDGVHVIELIFNQGRVGCVFHRNMAHIMSICDKWQHEKQLSGDLYTESKISAVIEDFMDDFIGDFYESA